ncbi:MAG: hypothetical protein AAGC60_11045 [Acidobacteriota bacterium]
MRRALPIALLVALTAIGCRSTDPAPFDAFTLGTRALRDSADVQARSDLEAARATFLDQVERGEVEPFVLGLEFPGPTPFDAALTVPSDPDGQEIEPLYLQLERFRGALWTLNQALVDYAELLATLAGSSTPRAESDSLAADQFDTLAVELNAALAQATPALRLDAPRQRLALISGTATALFRQAIESRRRHHLEAAIREVQPAIEDVGAHLQTSTELLAGGVQTQYQRSFRALLTDPALDRRSRAEAIVALNDRTRSTLRTLALLDAGYAELPAAHAELAAAASTRPTGTAAADDFARRATQLRQTVDRLATQESP